MAPSRLRFMETIVTPIKVERRDAPPLTRVMSGRVEKRKSGPLKEWDCQNVVTFVVGEEQTCLTAHKDLACHYCPVFNSAFNSQFIEEQTQIYKLPDVSVPTARLLIKWFYTQSIAIQQLTLPRKEAKAIKASEDRQLVELWVLADKLLIPQLQNQVIRLMEEVRIKFKMTCTKGLKYVYENTEVGSPLRRLMVQQVAFNVESGWFAKKPEHFPQEFLLELVKVLSENTPEGEKDEKTRHRKIEDYLVEVPEEED